MDILVYEMMQDKKVKGVQIVKEEMVLMYWWHDFYIRNPREFIKRATEFFSDFIKVSGC